MIMYSAIPLELVFEGFDNFSPGLIEIPFSRGYIQFEIISPAEGKIVKLISCDIQDYLNPTLAPGTIIKFGLKI